MKFKVYQVTLNETKGSSTKSPDMSPSSVSGSIIEINKYLGTKLPRKVIVRVQLVAG